MGKQTKRPPKGEKSAIKDLQRQMQRNGLFKDNLMRLQETEGPKVSGLILELIAPYKHLAPTPDAYEKLVTLGVVAWNAAILQGKERQALIDTMVKTIVETAGEQWRQDTQDSIEQLLRRKLLLFADDRRYVVDYRLTDTGAEVHLSVASMPMR